MSILNMDDSWFFFAVREDMLKNIRPGDTIQVHLPALGKETYPCQVRRVQAMASYATWRATKTNGQYDVKSFDVKAVPLTEIKDMRPGMTAIIED
jgi:HlyD family secretion protein